MAVVKQTLATFMANFFGKSEKAISEKLSTDEHNQFTTEALELQQKVSSLEGERDTLQSQVTGLESQRDTLQGQVTALEGQRDTLQSNLTDAQAERDKYKAWFERRAGAGAQLPEADASSQGGEPLADFNADALAYFRKFRADQ